MKIVRWLLPLLLVGAATASLAGDIQVVCEPGLRVFLDGTLAGTSTSQDDGLFLAGVSVGKHAIRIEKDGFAPQSFQIAVQDAPMEVRVAEFVPVAPTGHDRDEHPAEGRRAVGGLVIMSAPQDCTVEIDGRPEVKTTPMLRIVGLEPGDHSVAFSKPGYDRIAGAVVVRAGMETSVRGDLKAGKVETVYEGHGSLRVVSSADHFSVRIVGAMKETTRGLLNLSYIPAGVHRLVVEWRGRKLFTEIVIGMGQRTIVAVSFVKGKEPFVVSYEAE